jgi:hypothetical protein
MARFARTIREYGAVLRVTTVQRDARSAKVMGGLGVFMTVMVIVALSASKSLRHEMTPELVLRALAAIAAFWLMLGSTMLFAPGSQMLNSAANARLLPRQRRRLIHLAAAGWLLQSAAWTAAFGNWAVFPLAGLCMLGTGLTFAGFLPGIALIVLPTNWLLISRVLLPPALAESLQGTPGLLAATAMVLLATAWGLRWMYPAGGDAHLDKRAKHLERIQRMQSGGSWSHNVESGTMTGSSVLRFYAAALRRDCGGKRPADPGRMLLHALGPAAHWSIWIASVVVMLAIALAIHLLVAWRGVGASDAFRAGIGSGLTGFVAMILFSTAQLGQSIGKTRGEQALLRLTPLLGDARLLNRRLATQLLRRAAFNWLGLTATVLVVTLLIAGPDMLPRQLGLCALAGQAAMMGLLGDYAGDGGWNLPRALGAGLVALVVAGIAAGLGWLTGTPVWGWLIAVAILVAAIQLRRSWTRMLAAPPAFPARRLALS